MSESKGRIAALVERAQAEFGIVGRQAEMHCMALALLAGRNLLIEGPVGCGKTYLAQAVAAALGRRVVRVDGDGRYTEQKLIGTFDPASAMQRGYREETFVPGPLTDAMRHGAILFVNELNRMPEGVQNVLLPAMDEGRIEIPQLGVVEAAKGFQIVATQNPREFVATSQLSEAVLDRFEWLHLDYQSETEEREIARRASGYTEPVWVEQAVCVVRHTRCSPLVHRGASVRAAVAILQILKAHRENEGGEISEADFETALMLALPTRIELAVESEQTPFAEKLTALLDELKKNSAARDSRMSGS